MTGTDVPRWRPSRPGGPGSPAKQLHNRNSKLPIRAGLSPRVRSHRTGNASDREVLRSISACAESSERRDVLAEARKVYLRVCGVIHHYRRPQALLEGLSPRVRSHPPGSRAHSRSWGSISACAESSTTIGSSLCKTGVYLRVCGVIRKHGSPSTSTRGLSPRVRSHRAGRSQEAAGDGSISACAESSSVGSELCWSPRVYLRVCGVIHTTTTVSKPSLGLSPRVRSHLAERYVIVSGMGSISACAESSSTLPAGGWQPRVYLRVCGVIASARRQGGRSRGLSPRVRSHRRCRAVAAARSGSISACAESSEQPQNRYASPRVYLRVCGVISHWKCQASFSLGLSPRVRSHPSEAVGRAQRRGSISACAESSALLAACRSRSRVYLRVCGVIESVGLNPFTQPGLSPRVRSHHPRLLAPERDQGSISACAESSRRLLVAMGLSRVYLRVCGVIRPCLCDGGSARGLSPRVRSHRPEPGQSLRGTGSISACAESSRCRGNAEVLG